MTAVVWLPMRQVAAADAVQLCLGPASELALDIVEEVMVGAFLDLCAEVAIDFNSTTMPLFATVVGLTEFTMVVASVIGLTKAVPRRRCLEGATPACGPSARLLAMARRWRAPGLMASLAMGPAHARCPGTRPWLFSLLQPDV